MALEQTPTSSAISDTDSSLETKYRKLDRRKSSRMDYFDRLGSSDSPSGSTILLRHPTDSLSPTSNPRYSSVSLRNSSNIQPPSPSLRALPNPSLEPLPSLGSILNNNSSLEPLPSLDSILNHPAQLEGYKPPEQQHLDIPDSPRPTASRALRPRKPEQVQPFTNEQRRYKSYLQRTDWTDAIVPLKAISPIQSSSQSSLPPDAQDISDEQYSEFSSDPEGVDRLADSQIGQFTKRNYHQRPKDSSRTSNRPRFRDDQSLQPVAGPSSAQGSLRKPVSHSSHSVRPTKSVRPKTHKISSQITSNRQPKIYPLVSNNLGREGTPDIPRAPGRSNRSPISTFASPETSGPVTCRFTTNQFDHNHKKKPRKRSRVDGYARSIVGVRSPNSKLSSEIEVLPGSEDVPTWERSEGVEDTEDQENQGGGEEEEEEEEEEECSDQTASLEALRPKKVKLKLLNRMMPRVYVKKAEKDLKLMAEERRSGKKLKLTVDSDGSDYGSQRSRSKTRSTRRPRSKSAESDDSDPSDFREQERRGLHWADKMRSRINEDRSGCSRTHTPLSSPISRQTTPQRPLTTSKKKSQPHELYPAISLKDDHALWRTYESANGRPALDLPPPGLHQANLKIDTKLVWDFKDFTPDFSIRRLRPGILIKTQTGYISEGHLTDLLREFGGKVSGSSCLSTSHKGFGFKFDDLTLLEDWNDRLIVIADRIQDELSAWLGMDPGSSKTALLDTASFLRFTAKIMSTAEDRLITRICDWTVDLINRIDDLVVDAINRPEFSNYMIVLSWGLFELTCRALLNRQRRSHIFDKEPVDRIGPQSMNNLIRRLLEYGPPVTMGRLKALIDSEESELFDFSTEVWASLLNLVNHDIQDQWKPEFLQPQQFWEHLVQLTRQHATQAELSEIAQREAVCYLSMMVCAISQISSDGVSVPEPRMTPQWQVLGDSFGSLPEHILTQPITVPILRSRRDQYVRALYARVMVFNERWKWTVGIHDGLIERLYTILNSSQLQRLPLEISDRRRYGDLDRLPDVINDLGHQATHGLLKASSNRGDTCFGMFLKVLINAHQELSRPIDARCQRDLARLVARCNPLRKLTYKPLGELGQIDAAITPQARSALVNHFSLFLVYAVLIPSTLKRQVSHLTELCRFEELDDIARRTYLKLWGKAAVVLRALGVDKEVVIGKLSEALNGLRVEYHRLKERERVLSERVAAVPKHSLFMARGELPSAEELKHTVTAVENRVELCVQVIKLLQELADLWKKDEFGVAIYPSVAWLESAWISVLDESSLAKESQVINAFIELIWKLLSIRAETMEQVEKDVVRMKEVEGLLAYEQSRTFEIVSESLDETEIRMVELDSELNELQESIKRFKNHDDEFVKQLHGMTTMRNVLSRWFEYPSHIGINLLRTLGSIDRIRVKKIQELKMMDCYKEFEKQQQEDKRLMALMGYMLAILDGDEGIEIYLEMREEVLKIWMVSMIASEFSLQGPLTSKLIELESRLEQSYLKLIPRLEITELPKEWWMIRNWEIFSKFEEKRIQILERMFKKIYEELMNVKEEETRKEKMKFYKNRIGELIEGISNENRRLLIKKNELRSRSRNEYIRMINLILFENLLNDEKFELNRFINFDSLPKLRMLKPILDKHFT